MGEPGTQSNTEPKVRYLRIITYGRIWYWGGHRYVLAITDNDVVRQVKNVTNRQTPIRVIMCGDTMPLIHHALPRFKKDKTKEYLIFNLTKPLYPTWYILHRKRIISVEIEIPIKNDNDDKVM